MRQHVVIYKEKERGRVQFLCERKEEDQQMTQTEASSAGLEAGTRCLEEEEDEEEDEELEGVEEEVEETLRWRLRVTRPEFSMLRSSSRVRVCPFVDASCAGVVPYSERE